MRTVKRKVSLVLALFLLHSVYVRSQIIFSESFEGTFPPAGWTIVTTGTGSPWAENTNAAYSFSGLKAMQRTSNNTPANTWAFTQNLALTTGIYYRISYWYRESLPGRVEKMKVTLGNAPTIAAQTITLNDHTDIPNMNYLQGSSIFSVAANGNYNIGFNCYSNGNIAALIVDSVVFEQLAPLTCSGTPVAGTVYGPASVCSGVNFNLNLSGTYVSGGLTLQWQSSPASANNFTNIAGATNSSLSTSQTTATDYRCVVTCANSGNSTVSAVFPVGMKTTCYCIPPAGDCSLGYISNVTIGAVNNNSACTGSSYVDYSGQVPVINLTPGTSVPISVMPGGITLTQNIGAWVDFNRNGVFEASEYKNLGSGYDVVNSTIDVPAGASIGQTVMRIKSKSGAAMNSANFCQSYTYGETEDYLVNISYPVCSGAPVAGTTTSSSGTVCPDVAFVLKVSGSTTGNSGISYQWQTSANGSSWTDVVNGTADTLIASQNAATYYRRKIACSASGLSAFSTGLQIGMNPYTSCYCTPGNSTCSGSIVVRIDSVGFSSIHNVSGCDGVNGYSNYTGTVAAAPVQAGTYVPMTIKLNNSLLTKYVAVGIDFNHNGIFDASETTYGSGTYLINLRIRIAFTAITGPVRMRVRSSYYDTQPGFCWAQSYGEAEDYMVNITAPATPGPAFSFYVNPVAVGNGDGLSWTNAFTSLMNTLSFVLPGDTIRVAKATYTVSGSPYYFNVKDSVVLLGGYPNTGNPGDALRNWSANQTILSGSGVPVTMRGANGFTLDGFILQDSYTYPSDGGALRITNGVLPKIKHCVFKNNHCFSAGPGSAIRISNSSPVISDCFFMNNTDDGGSAVYIESNSNVVFNNCAFVKNHAKASVIESSQSTTGIINCNFVSNYTDTNATVFAKNNTNCNIRNSIFFNNARKNSSGFGEYSADSADIQTNNATLSVLNTITQAYNYGNALLLAKNPKFKDTSNIAGADNLLYTADDGLQLNNPCSPAMNAGSNAAVAGLTTDILGNSRIFSSAVDIGAYEIQTTPLSIPKTLYVNKLATGNGSGSSWTNAMTDLRLAMESCSDTIRVAAGIYYPSDNDELKSIWLENKRVILGGYPNTGNPTDAQRNPTANPTVLSGELPNGGGLRSDILLRGRTVDSTSVTDGLIIKKALSSNVDAMGAIYLVQNTNPVFRNCIISDNISDGRGAALINKTSSNPKFENCVFENNVQTNIGEGGAVANINSNPVFRKCTFRYNSNYIAGVAPSSGGAVYNEGSTSLYDSCVFLKNLANNWGGAMDNLNSSPVITNCSFLGNFVSTGNANDINNNHSSPQVYNCFFSDSSSCNYGGSVVNLNQSNPSFTKCEFKNGRANTAGGACYNDNSSPVFTACIFNATAAGDGGAINNQNASNPVLINCIGFANAANGQGSFMYNNNSNPIIKNTSIVNGTLPSLGNSFRGGVIVNNNNTQLTITNSILWGNTVVSGQNTPNGDILDLSNGSTPTIMNNCISQVFGVNGVNANLVGADPLFINVADPDGADNKFFTNDDGLSLASCSPAINAGANNFISGTSIDIAGNTRIYNSIVDMGPYEYQAIPGQTTNTWTGAVSNTWENPLNWSQGILPNACTNVVINGGTVLLSSNATIYSLTLNSGANITVHTGFNLLVLH